MKIAKNHHYSSQTNAAGNTVVDLVNSKRTITIGLIHMSDAAMVAVQQAISPFGVSISFLNPETNTLEENVNCIIPSNNVEYYTIQAKNVLLKGTNLTFTEL